MKKRTVIRLLACVLLVAMAILGCSCNGVANDTEGDATEAPKLLVRALRVKVDAAVGEFLGIKDVEVVEVERSLAPDDYLTATNEIVGRALLSDVKAGDHIKFDGEIYTINGEPKKWTAAARLSNIQLNLIRWKG